MSLKAVKGATPPPQIEKNNYEYITKEKKSIKSKGKFEILFQLCKLLIPHVECIISSDPSNIKYRVTHIVFRN